MLTLLVSIVYTAYTAYTTYNAFNAYTASTAYSAETAETAETADAEKLINLIFTGSGSTTIHRRGKRKKYLTDILQTYGSLTIMFSIAKIAKLRAKDERN